MSLDFESATDWTSIGEDSLDDAITLRRAIHADPEVGLHCPRTSDKVKAALAGLPLEIREGGSAVRDLD
ncbi:MAG: amidohydrolase, partial [Sphingomonas sp.]